jgi:hypothetical protein
MPKTKPRASAGLCRYQRETPYFFAVSSLLALVAAVPENAAVAFASFFA